MARTNKGGRKKKGGKQEKNFLQQAFPPIHPEGIKFTALAGGIAVLGLMLNAAFGFFLLLLTLCVYGFFRDPERQVPQGKGIVVSPADGIVCDVSETSLPRELDMPDDGKFRKISVFMSVFNVHVNRCPVAGTVEKAVYVPGKFLNAELDKASEDNERQLLLLKTAEGDHDVGVVQIAGLIARRILCEVEEGDDLKTGERFGLIRFGSRVDVYLPKSAEVKVVVGQTMVAGETVIAKM